MKIKNFSFVMLIIASLTLSSAINTYASADDDYSCTVTVYYKDGSLAKNLKVTTDVSGGISCIGGRDFETNKSGEVTLKWAKGCNLKKVFVKGKGYSVDYKDGKTYNLNLDI